MVIDKERKGSRKHSPEVRYGLTISGKARVICGGSTAPEDSDQSDELVISMDVPPRAVHSSVLLSFPWIPPYTTLYLRLFLRSVTRSTTIQ